ncbi:hypothetical protein BJP34_07075 [Moorena producens PAL-8-15-08-1]|uniref:Uncharacterized protein n=2 Tax=Moorena TaxID=1155738 RepID=A0A1D8TNN1_9CYAN|nr:hypothetical protein BJP34_07075 [Moorena producens PAL-8-15-08-1]OLT58777.1 hypothetical protein BJP37_06695 [Moorena bouillonii PNG]
METYHQLNQGIIVGDKLQVPVNQRNRSTLHGRTNSHIGTIEEKTNHYEDTSTSDSGNYP